MKQLKSLIIFIVILVIFFLPINVAFATNIDTSDYNPDKIKTNSPSVILTDANTGKILYSKSAFEKRFPASTTKLMTAILALENCELSDVAIVSHNAIFSIPIGYSHASLKEGEKLTIEQLLNVLLIPSANDAAVVLAEHIAGSVENFSEMMNNKAKELGCVNTHFVNPNGIHDENHYSCAYDLAIIGRYAMKFEDIMRIAKVNQYTLPKTNKYDKTDRIFNSTNGLINKNSEYYNKYATGLKTGYTDKSGYCIVTTANQSDVELLAVVLGSESIDDRYEDCNTLFDYCFENYSYKSLINSREIIENVKVSGATSETKSLNIIAKNNVTALVKNDLDIESVEPKIEINENLTAPIAQDAVVGRISYTVDGETFSTDLIAETSVEKSNIETIIFRAFLIFLILYLLVIILKKINKPRNNNSYFSTNRTAGKRNYAKKSNAKKSKKSKKGKKQKFSNIEDDEASSSHGGHYKFNQIIDYL